jgi:hypothetical protein
MKSFIVSTPIVLTFIAILLVPHAALAKTFTTKNVEEGNYSFQYPNNWKTEKLNRFHSFDARVVYGNNDAQINFESGSPIDYLIFDANDTEATTTALETMAERLFDGAVQESGADKYVINGHPAPYVIVTYQSDPGLFGNSLDMAAQVTMVHLNDDQVALVQYVAEEDDFDKFLPKAEQVIKSITPIGYTGGDSNSGSNSSSSSSPDTSYRNGVDVSQLTDEQVKTLDKIHEYACRADPTAETCEKSGSETTETKTDNSFTSRGDHIPKTSTLCDTVTTQSKDLCETLLN